MRQLVIGVLVAFAVAACSSRDSGAHLKRNLERLADDAVAAAERREDIESLAVGQFASAECEFESDQSPAPECGWLRVPMVRDDITGAAVDDRTIDIHVAVYPAWGLGEHDDPIVYLEGGPGISALSEADVTAEWLWQLNEDRDLILFDQRGLGASTPALRCPEVDAAFAKLPDDATEALSIERERLAAAVCRDRLTDEGVDVAAFNTIAAAHDVADLRVALALSEWNVLGISYGTRLAQTMLRERPEGIRSVVLDGAYPLSDDPLYSIPRTGVAALERLFAACRADQSCEREFPDLERRFRDLVDSLDDEPWPVDFGDGTTEWVHDVSGADLVDAVTSSLYDAYSFVDLPRLVEVTEKGETWALAAFVGSPISGLGDAATIGTYLSVNCRDEVAFSDVPDPLPEGSLAGDDVAFVEDNLAACDLWDVGTAPAVENTNVTSPLPALIMVGTFDPITPVEHGAEVAAGYPNATFVEFGDRGHGTLGGWCSNRIALEFLDDPTATLDVSCVDELPSVEFVPTDVGPLGLVSAETELSPTVETEVPLTWMPSSDVWYRDWSLLDYTSLGVESTAEGSVRDRLDELEDLYGPLDTEELIDESGTRWRVARTVHLSDHITVAVASFDEVVVTVTLTAGLDEWVEIEDTIWLEVLSRTRPA